MQKFISILALLTIFTTSLTAQKYFTRNGKISFFSDAPLEKIEAVNNSATSVLDTESGKMEFAVLIKGFQFAKSLMQEHFNENYMESSKYPKAIFKGEITNLAAIDFKQDGEYPAEIKGQLTIHGVTKDRDINGTFVVKNGVVAANSVFNVTVAEHNIEIPGVVKDNIAKEVQVKVEVDLEPFNK